VESAGHFIRRAAEERDVPNSITPAARVDGDLDAKLNRLASVTGRSKSWLINEALRSFVVNEQQFLAAVEEGKQALREGRTLDHATVVAAFDRLVTSNQ
jgi:predicted transcriptional regulator